MPYGQLTLSVTGGDLDQALALLAERDVQVEVLR